MSLKNSCSVCHGSGTLQPGTTEDDCYNCHSSSGVASTKYESAGSPSHTSLNFSHNCRDCHNESAWSPASYSHQSFNLQGPHTPLQCDSCHSTGYPGNYAGVTESDCYACHAGDYQGAPNHVSANYSQDCTQCHSGNSWAGATLHQNFQLRGKHASLNCDKCHKSGYPGQYAGVSDDDCYACHAKDYNKKHQTCSHDCTLCHNLYNWGHPGPRQGCK